ncbi:MAG TPA: phospholipase D-like domain-containing protein [Planctomycetota bacterium]|nr:phospholipase D-like domain-containing protein [Planctomycetota bacterium]
MNVSEWDDILRLSSTDGKISSGERSALRERIKDAALDERQKAVFQSRAFEEAREVARNLGADGALAWLEDIVKLLNPAHAPSAEDLTEVHFSPGEACAQTIIARFRTCRRSADVCVFTITDDRISNAVIDAHRRGVAVRVVTDDEKANDPGSDALRLAGAGVGVRVDDSPYHMHHKFAVFDRNVVISGSYNWTVSAARNNEENLIVSGDRRLVAAFESEFNRLWAKFAGHILSPAPA